MATKFPGKGLSNTQTSSTKGSKAPHGGGASSVARGARMDPPKGAAQFPGRALSSTQTRNSPPTKR